MKKNIKALPLFYYFIIILLFQSLQIWAQSKPKEINDQYQTWVSLNSTIRVNNKWGFIGDIHMKRNHFFSDPAFYFVRTGVNYWLKENVTLAFGYGHLWQAPAKPGWQYFAQENRIYQQIQMSSKIGKIALLNRLRNEQRWQEIIVNDAYTHHNKFTNRVRYLLSMNIPLFKNPHYPLFVISDELMIQFGKEIVYNTFDQNRAFVGIKQSISKSLSFDFGYMLVYQQKSTGYQYDNNQTLRCFLYYSPDCRKK